MISYKPLWIQLVKKDKKKTDLLTIADISRGTLSKMSKNEPVTLKIIDNICRELSCRIEDVIEYLPDEDPQKGERDV